jgi:hypothetical protein
MRVTHVVEPIQTLFDVQPIRPLSALIEGVEAHLNQHLDKPMKLAL